MRLRLAWPAAAVIAAATLSACGGTFTSDAPVSHAYVLRPAVEATRGGGEASVRADRADETQTALRVARPVPGPGFETDRILLSKEGRRVDFYANGHWAAPIPDLLAALTVESLRTTDVADVVHGEGAPFPADYVLHMTVRHFEARYDAGDSAPTVRVTLDCTVGRRLDRTVLASFVADAEAPAQANRLGDVVAAFESAAQGAIGQIAAELDGKLGAAVRTSTAPSPP